MHHNTGEYGTIDSEAGIVLSLFLIFGDFEPRCYYKIVLIKKVHLPSAPLIKIFSNCMTGRFSGMLVISFWIREKRQHEFSIDFHSVRLRKKWFSPLNWFVYNYHCSQHQVGKFYLKWIVKQRKRRCAVCFQKIPPQFTHFIITSYLSHPEDQKLFPGS